MVPEGVWELYGKDVHILLATDSGPTVLVLKKMLTKQQLSSLDGL